MLILVVVVSRTRRKIWSFETVSYLRNLVIEPNLGFATLHFVPVGLEDLSRALLNRR